MHSVPHNCPVSFGAYNFLVSELFCIKEFSLCSTAMCSAAQVMLQLQCLHTRHASARLGGACVWPVFPSSSSWTVACGQCPPCKQERARERQSGLQLLLPDTEDACRLRMPVALDVTPILVLTSDQPHNMLIHVYWHQSLSLRCGWLWLHVWTGDGMPVEQSTLQALQLMVYGQKTVCNNRVRYIRMLCNKRVRYIRLIKHENHTGTEESSML